MLYHCEYDGLSAYPPAGGSNRGLVNWIASAFALRATADKSSRSLLSVAYFARPKAQSDNSYQEQIQMIAAAIGTPKPSAPKVARTNSESRFAWGRASGNGMALLLEAPASLGSSPG